MKSVDEQHIKLHQKSDNSHKVLQGDFPNSAKKKEKKNSIVKKTL